MIGEHEAAVLDECYRQAGPDTSIQQYTEDGLRENIDKLGNDPDEMFNQFRRFFDIVERRPHSEDDLRVSAGGTMAEAEEEIAIFQFDIDRLLREWAEKIRYNEVFDSFQLAGSEGGQWYAEAVTEQEQIRFNIFFSEDELERYSFEPSDLEFPVAFVQTDMIENDFVFSWHSLIEDGFAARFNRKITRVSNAISSSFYEYEPLDLVRERVRDSIRSYLRRSGFDVSEEVTEACPEIHKYGVDPAQVDFVGAKNGSTLVICHCDVNDGWHAHHLADGRLRSVEEMEEFADLRVKARNKINSYLEIQQNKSLVSNWVKLFAALFPVITIALSIFNFSTIIDLVSGGSILGISSGGIWLLLFAAYTIAVVGFLVLVSYPYIYDWWFDWEISAYEADSGGNSGNEDLQENQEEEQIQHEHHMVDNSRR